MAKKIALVLSGGGAKGAFQAGALQYIYEEFMPLQPEFRFQVVSGVSVGCLNGAMLAQNKFAELLEVWNTVENGKIYKGKLSVAQALWRIGIKKKRSLLDIDPLVKLLDRHVSWEDSLNSGISFSAGTVSLIDGRYHSYRPEDFTDSLNYRKAVLASATMPIFWEPVNRIESKGKIITEVVDGGLRNNSPLGDVLDQDPDEVVIINCGPFSRDNVLIEPQPDAAKNAFTIAKRSLLDIALNEIFITDLREYLNLNHLVRQAKEQNISLKNRKGKALKAYKTILISPEHSLGDVLDFSQPSVQERMKMGFKAAEKALQGYADTKNEHALYANIPLP